MTRPTQQAIQQASACWFRRDELAGLAFRLETTGLLVILLARTCMLQLADMTSMSVGMMVACASMLFIYCMYHSGSYFRSLARLVGDGSADIYTG